MSTQKREVILTEILVTPNLTRKARLRLPANKDYKRRRKKYYSN